MTTYIVTYEGTVKETYAVEADSEEQAREIWSDFDLVTSEVIEGGITAVEEEE